MSGNTSEPNYEVVWPLGASAYKTRAPNARIDDLSGKVVGELWDFLFRGEDIFPIVREELSKRYPGIRFVTYDVFGNVHGPQQRELVVVAMRVGGKARRFERNAGDRVAFGDVLREPPGVGARLGRRASAGAADQLRQ